MNKLLIIIVSLNVIFVNIPSVYSADDSLGNEQERNAIAAHDYVGIYMEVPEKVQKIIELETDPVKSIDLIEKIYLNGRVPQDVETITDVYAPQSGVLKECFEYLGMKVEAGQRLCILESDSDQKRVEIVAPHSGVLLGDFKKQGDRVDTFTPVLSIADFSLLPVNFDVYEKDMGKIHVNQKVYAYSSAYPDKTFEGKVIFISPRIDESSFTLKIRAMVQNPEYLLKPGMFLRGEAVLGGEGASVAVSPESVQNVDGIHVVFVQDEKESFIPTEVEVLFKDIEQTIIRGDVAEGNRVVTKGAYYLKSKMMESEIVGGCAHGH